MDNKYQRYDASIIKPIKEIEFGILPNDEIRKMSVLAGSHGVEVSDLYDKQEPKRGGLNDPRMGGSGNTVCATCQLDGKYCDGHPAHIDLAEPVFHILFHPYVKGILDCICIGCSNLLIAKDNEKLKSILQIKSKRNRFIKIHELAGKAKFCLRAQQNCGIKVSKIKLEIKKSKSEINIYSETDTINVDNKGIADKRKQRVNLTPDVITEIFDNISDEDCRILGIEPEKFKPSDMIHRIFHVPPIHVRPSIRGYFSGGSTMEDQLTHKLSSIIKHNTRINKQKENNTENSSKYSKDHGQLLQLYVAEYYVPDVISIPKTDEKVSKPLVERFKGKTGRIRGNIMGKRGDFNARTVITPDPTIGTNYLGVPVKIAMNITFPEFVTSNNYDRLTLLVRNGSDIYPGANYVYRSSEGGSVSNKPIFLKLRKETIVLQYGDVVERHLQDDDIVLLNRQPTLHKQSMMGHKIKIINDPMLLTFRLSVAITTPYAADFDGDEMNLFCPQCLQTSIELEQIADVKKQIILPAKSVTIYGIVQDGLIGAYNLTDDRVKINWRDAMNIMSYTTFDNFEKFKKGKEYNGSELFSLMIPSKVTMKSGDVEIKNGELLKGRLSNSILGAKKKNNLLHYIWDEYGEDETINFIDNCQRLSNNFNLLNGFTIGIRDSYVPTLAKQEIETYLELIMNKVDIEITNIENNPTYMDVRIFETKIFGDLNGVRDDVSKIVAANVYADNSFNIMINCGSKGTKDNLGQTAGCVGSQVVEGMQLMPKIYNDRTLCYFHENDDRSKSRGLCYNSYMDGLSYSEFVYHTKAGRSGLITNIAKTPETGYAQRKLVKTMEDVMIKYDGTVRSANNQIIQHIYGGNGNDTTMQYEYRINMMEMNNETLEKNFKYTQNELKEFTDFSQKYNQEFYNTIKNLRNQLRLYAVKSKMDYKTIANSYMLPINIVRILSSMNYLNENNKKISPKYIIDTIENLLSINETPLIRIPRSTKNNLPKLAVQDDMTAKTILRAVLYDSLNPKLINDKYKLSKKLFDELIENVKMQFTNNIAEPGEMVGIIAGQSLGEAVTQSTISSFHKAGIASKTQSTTGVPRINELISASKNTKTPNMFIYLNKSSRTSKEIAHRISSYLEKTTLGNIRGKLDVYYDPMPKETGSIMEKDGITDLFYGKKLSKNKSNANIENLPWLFRIEIDKEKMLEKEVTLLDIKTKFGIWWNRKHINTKKKKEKISILRKITSFAILSNNDNDTQPVIHIRFNVKDIDKADNRKGSNKTNLNFNRKTLTDFIEMLDKFKLKGIEKIENTSIIKERYVDVNDDDNMAVSEEQVIFTSGVNLYDIRYINNIDIYRTFSDDVFEMFNTFGIEFARNRMIGEFLKAYETAGNNGINPQHISLLVDIMCHGGTVISADRNGMKKANVDPLTKASFEKSIDVLVMAAVFGDIDKMQGVSSRLYIGSVFKGGTGYCELVLDTKAIQNSEYIEKEVIGVKTDIAINTIANAIMDDKDNEGDDIFIPE